MISDISEGFRSIVDTNHNVNKLEKENRFTDTVLNKRNLADEYMKKSRVKDAISLYESCLTGFYMDDPDINQRLIRAYFIDKRYADCIKAGEILANVIAFQKAEERALLAWAYYYEGQKEIAITFFKQMDSQFSNYLQRLEYCKLLILEGERENAKNKLQKMLIEIDHMDSYEQKLKRAIYKEIEAEYNKNK